MIYAIAEALRIVEEEGMPAREARHRAAAAELIAKLAPLGFTPLVDAAVRLPTLRTLRLPGRIIAWARQRCDAGCSTVSAQ